MIYYSEKIINRVLHSKNHPDGKYEPLTPEQLTTQIVELKKQLSDSTKSDWCSK